MATDAQKEIFDLVGDIAASQGRGGEGVAAAAPYLVYTALLSQSGTDAPVATVMQNTLGGPVVWSYNGTGEYIATLSGVFTANKTAAFCTGIHSTDPRGGSAYTAQADSSNIVLIVFLQDNQAPADGYLNNSFFEIRVYPS